MAELETSHADVMQKAISYMPLLDEVREKSGLTDEEFYGLMLVGTAIVAGMWGCTEDEKARIKFPVEGGYGVVVAYFEPYPETTTEPSPVNPETIIEV